MFAIFGRVLSIVFLSIGYTHGFIFNDVWRCPPSVHRSVNVIIHNNHCYEFKLDVEKYWDGANDDCRSRGGHLVVIKDRDTQEFLMTSLRYLGYKSDSVWIGLTDKKIEHDWRWVTGERLQGYSHWKPGQDEDGFLHYLQDCVYLKFTDSGLWYDVVCNTWPEYFSYICQYDAISSPTRRTPPPTTATTATTGTTRITTTPKPTTPIPTVKTTTTTTTTTTALPTTVVCSAIDCAKACPGGYSGLQVGLDGCIQCRCT